MVEENEHDEELEEFDKAIGQFRLAVGKLLKPLRMYGQGNYVDGIHEQLVSLGVQLYQRLEGIDEPYYIEDTHW